MLNIENISERFIEIVRSPEWIEFQEKFNNCDDIYVLGHGGNLAVADHTAVDITRLSNGQKNAICPGSGVVATSFINDTNLPHSRTFPFRHEKVSCVWNFFIRKIDRCNQSFAVGIRPWHADGINHGTTNRRPYF